MKKITKDEFKVIAKYVSDISGIYLDDSKTYLVETRLSRIIEEIGCATYSELYYKAKSDPTKTIERRIIDAISTNETLFFRDSSPFELLQHKILPEIIDRKTSGASKLLKPNIRIWSAACSTGQEVYSIAIIIKELIHNPQNYNFKILATDISNEAIAQASYGQYNQFEIERGLPKDKMQKYFSSNGNHWRIKDEIRAMVTFKRHHLMEPLNGLGKFDIIFCRNVAIYFTQEDRTRLFDKIADILETDGYLIIGSSEYLTGISTKFKPKSHLRSVFYQLHD
jgi:chemotaxis protein methyltransferase CheR